MTENRTARRSNTGKWVFLIIGIVLALIVTCVMSLVWGGLLGFALGRATAPERYAQTLPYDPFEPFPELPYEAARPWLGVYYQMQDNGALVTEIIHGSPAQRSRLKVGDIITEIDGQRINETYTLADAIQIYSPGDRIALTILSNGREHIVRVRLAARLDTLPIEPDWDG